MESLGAIVLNNTYRDSVFLMKISSEICSMEGIIEASAMMGTDRNKDLFLKSGLSNDQVKAAKSDDLIISIKAENEKVLNDSIVKAKELLSTSVSTQNESNETRQIKRLEQALKEDKNANVLMLSCAGDYAKYEAAKGLSKGMNIMLYSDNISIEDELALKQKAHEKGLLVMGPDCGTSIINQVPLAFANNIRKGSIGVVGASGTGIQEVTSIIHRNHGGISQAIGTGGRDPKKEIGGITMMDALELLKEDEETQVILIVSKPPCMEVQNKIASFIRSTNKPVVVNFAGNEDYSLIEEAGGQGFDSLKRAAIAALELSGLHECPEEICTLDQKKLSDEIANLSQERKYLRGIYSGGSLCYEAMYFARKCLSDLYSNTPMKGVNKLENVRKSMKNLFLDMGEDEFTVGKPHPMIDPTEKVKRIKQELQDKEVAVILTDCVIGYGSFEDPAQVIADAVMSTRKECDQIPLVVTSVCGTEEDFQVYSTQVKKLQEAGILVASSNEEAIKLCLDIMKQNKGECDHV